MDILCYRISLSQKLLAGTKKYQKPSDVVDDAIKLLEGEVGTLTGVPVKMGRGIVNRLSSGQEVQRLCGSAVELFESMYHQTPLHLGNPVNFACIILGYIFFTSLTMIVFVPFFFSFWNFTIYSCTISPIVDAQYLIFSPYIFYNIR